MGISIREENSKHQIDEKRNPFINERTYAPDFLLK